MIDRTVEYLNELLALDGVGISELFTKCSLINEAIADYPHAIVGYDLMMGPLGLINGLMSLMNLGLIEAVIDDEDGSITEFRKREGGCSSLAEPPVQNG